MSAEQALRDHYRGVEERLRKRPLMQELTTVARLRSKNESLQFELADLRRQLVKFREENIRLRDLLRKNGERYGKLVDMPVGPASEILEAVCGEFNVPVLAVLGRSREGYLQPARREVMWRLRTILFMTMYDIGRFMNRDHSTVVHGLHVYCQMKGIDPVTRSLPKDLKASRSAGEIARETAALAKLASAS